MLQVKTILFPTDFTEHAARLARQVGAEIHVLNVVAPHRPEANNPMNFLSLEQEAGDELFYFQLSEEGTVSGEGRTPGDLLRVRYQQVRRASPVVAILEYADEQAADLIVMGTRGRGGVDRFLGGSVAEEVVRLARCPVLTVRAEEEEATPPPAAIERVLVPPDLSEHAADQVAHAAALAKVYQARLDLLHVVDEAAFVIVYGLGAEGPHPADLQERAHAALEKLAGDTRADVHVVTGHPARDIVDFAGEHGAVPRLHRAQLRPVAAEGGRRSCDGRRVRVARVRWWSGLQASIRGGAISLRSGKMFPGKLTGCFLPSPRPAVAYARIRG